MLGLLQSHFALILTALIVFAYAGSFWWLLRRENRTTLLILVSVSLLALSLRLVNTYEYPPGLNEDEPKTLHCVGILPLNAPSTLFGEGCTGVPSLLTALFEVQLVPLVGANRWAMRSYSIVTSVFSVVAAFAVGRCMGLRIGSSLAAGVLIAVLPWSLFFGRIEFGGELVLHQLLLLAALVTLMNGRGGWREVGIGAFGLCLLFYDYYCGRSMLGLIPVAAVLARGWRARGLILLIPLLAFAGWVPFLLQGSRLALVGLSTLNVGSDVMANPLQALLARGRVVLSTLVYPVASDGCLTTQASAVHPLLVLGLAAIGSLTAVRRGLLLWGGFLAGLMPAMLGWLAPASAHRMLNAFPFIALAAACAFDLIRWRAVRLAVTGMALALIAPQSIGLYFSRDAWPPASRLGFSADLEQLVDALPTPPHPRLIVASAIQSYFAPHALVDREYEFLSADNWFPNDSAAIYAFGGRGAAQLRRFYEAVFGPRVQGFGEAFVLWLDAGDRSWLRQYGWSYQVRCGSLDRRAEVPTLFHVDIAFEGVHIPCEPPALHTWGGRWRGSHANLRLHFTGTAQVQVGGRSIHGEGYQQFLDLSVDPDEEIIITLISPAPDLGPSAQLFEVTPAGERLPAWESVIPVSPQAADSRQMPSSAGPENSPT